MARSVCLARPAALLVFAWLSAGAALAGDQREIDPKAQDVLEQARQYLGQAQLGRVKLVMQTQAEGIPQVRPQRASVVFRFRGKQFALETTEGEPRLMIFCDGREVVIHVPELREFMVHNAPGRLADVAFADVALTGFAEQVGALAQPDQNLQQDLLSGASQVRYHGLELLRDAYCHRISWQTSDYAGELWIAAGQKPLAQRLRFDISQQYRKHADRLPEWKDAQVKVVVDYEEWALDTGVSAENFIFRRPEATREVDTFFAVSPVPVLVQDDQQHPLEGEQAPAFELEQLDGELVRLDQLKGQVVLLDFWATWCGPCVAGLPKIARIAERFEAQGAAFYAINLQEDAATVRQFLARKKLNIPVLLDTNGETAKDYSAFEIPQTVLIAKDGTVREVYTDETRNLERQLATQLQKLLNE